MATLIDVAKKAHVSPSSVSRYIRNALAVSPKKAHVIEETIKELGYTPNLGASFLKSNKTNIVGLILPSVHNSFFANILAKINTVTSSMGKQLIVLYARDFNEVKSQIRVLLSFRAEAILFIPENSSHTIKTLAMNSNCYMLQLFIDRFPQLDSLVVDDMYGGYLAARELIEHGHKKILFIDNKNDVFIKRLAGIKKAYEEFNIDLTNLQIVALENYEEIDKLVNDAIDYGHPSAIISVTETTSQQVCINLQTKNIRIPQDISLVVYDDSTWAKLASYTAISQPSDFIVEKIKNLLKANKSADQNQYEKIEVSPVLVRRASVKNI